MDDEPTTVEIDSRVYQLRPWSYKDGRRWLYRLITMAAGATGGGLNAVAHMLGRFSEKTFEEFCDTCVKYTDLVEVDEDGNRAVVQLTKVAAIKLRGRHLDLAKLIRAHIEAEYSDFFSRLKDEVLEGLEVEAEEPESSG